MPPPPRAGHRRPVPIAALAALLAVGACGPGDGGVPGEHAGPGDPDEAPSRHPVSVDDASGRTVALRAPARRIVSLVPSATRTLVELGAAGRLVGRTRYDTAPPRVAALPSVGGGLRPSLEALVELRPDLVIRFAAEADLRTPRRLDELGIAHFAVEPETIDDVRRMIRRLGVLVDRTGAADSLVARLDAGLRRVRAAVDTLPRIPAAYVLGGDPPRVAGPGTFIDELVGIAGGRNVFADAPAGYPQVSPEAFLARAPRVIVVPDDASGPDVPGARLERVPGSLLEDPGPGLHRAARALARALHPGALR